MTHIVYALLILVCIMGAYAVGRLAGFAHADRLFRTDLTDWEG